MKDKDARLLEEAYEQVGSYRDVISIKDETGRTHNIEGVHHSEDNTFTIRFGNSFSLSRIHLKDLEKIYNLLFDMKSASHFLTSYDK
jgi:hypothetical protein